MQSDGRGNQELGHFHQKSRVYPADGVHGGNGSLDFGKLKEVSDAEIIKLLTGIKGIGSWTAKMYLYKINRPDVLPYEDATFISAYKWLYRTRNVKPEAVKRRCRKWSPYSSIAAMYLYAAFDGNLISTESPKLKDL